MIECMLHSVVHCVGLAWMYVKEFAMAGGHAIPGSTVGTESSSADVATPTQIRKRAVP